jgi:hypothetical protein
LVALLPYDIFIAYSTVDFDYAKRLHTALSAAGRQVFLDRVSLPEGVFWPDAIREAQQDSLMTLILVSDRVAPSYFQQEEILRAIELSRDDKRRVILPLYLNGRNSKRRPRSPLTQIQSLFWEPGVSLLAVAQTIEAVLKGARRWDVPHNVVAKTIVIVTGCAALPEIFDRSSAYELKSAIDDIGRSSHLDFLFSTVMGDLWFIEHHPGHTNVISIGSSGINRLTQIIAEAGGRTERSGLNDRWQILRDAGRWALYGNLAQDTYDAVSSFKDRDLSGLLGETWNL